MFIYLHIFTIFTLLKKIILPLFKTFLGFSLSTSPLEQTLLSQMRQTHSDVRASQHLPAYVIATNKRKVALGEHLPRAILASL